VSKVFLSSGMNLVMMCFSMLLCVGGLVGLWACWSRLIALRSPLVPMIQPLFLMTLVWFLGSVLIWVV